MSRGAEAEFFDASVLVFVSASFAVANRATDKYSCWVGPIAGALIAGVLCS